MFHRVQLLSLLLASTALCRSLGNLQGMGSGLHERSLPSSYQANYSILEKRQLIKREDAPPTPGLDAAQTDSGDASKPPKKTKDGKKKEKDASKPEGTVDPNGDPKGKEKGGKPSSSPEDKAKQLQDKIDKQQKKVATLRRAAITRKGGEAKKGGGHKKGGEKKPKGPDEKPNPNGEAPTGEKGGKTDTGTGTGTPPPITPTLPIPNPAVA
ncbi:hypothetical protein PSHT_06000 [Puccinia striiformis]|uniref:Uncharacterized protein n=1 Tax=Puccinia striiformis TaxID=27350 RepID=A0A2S4W914_9BASI|nr:hypothetical protein PSHT_06000 [Puccinia striiformis]